MVARNQTATELGYHCGVSGDAVRRWLRGERRPSRAALMLLHQQLEEAGLTLDDLDRASKQPA